MSHERTTPDMPVPSMGGDGITAEISVVAFARMFREANQSVIEAAAQLFEVHLSKASMLSATMALAIRERLTVIQATVQMAKAPRPTDLFVFSDGRRIKLIEVLSRRPGAFVQTFKVEGENYPWTLLSILNTFLAHGITGSEVIHWFVPKVLTAEEAWKLPISAWQPMKVRTVDFLKATPGPGCEPLPSMCHDMGPSGGQPISPQGPAPGGVLPRPTTPIAQALRRQGSLQKSIPPRKPKKVPTPPAPKVPKQALAKGKPLTPRQRRRQFTPNKSVLMNEDEPEQLSSRPQRLRVHLQRGLEAEMSWPAFHVEGSECYFSGRTVPVMLRTISRPGGQLLQVIPKMTQAIIIKRIGKNEPFSYFVAYGPATRTFLQGLQHSDWKPCQHFNILGHDYLD